MSAPSNQALDFYQGKCIGLIEAGERTMGTTPEFILALINEIHELRLRLVNIGRLAEESSVREGLTQKEANQCRKEARK